MVCTVLHPMNLNPCSKCRDRMPGATVSIKRKSHMSSRGHYGMTDLGIRPFIFLVPLL